MTAPSLTSRDARSATTPLIDFALESLPAMRLSDGAFCFERRVGVPAPIGRSPRYTLMAELGLLAPARPATASRSTSGRCTRSRGASSTAPSSTPGDIGLMLWVDARRGDGRGDELAAAGRRAARPRRPARPARHGARVDRHRARVPRRGRRGRAARRLLGAGLDQLLGPNRADSHLFRHFGADGWRRRFPNFATQIYSVLALSVVARYGLDDRAQPRRAPAPTG